MKLKTHLQISCVCFSIIVHAASFSSIYCYLQIQKENDGNEWNTTNILLLYILERIIAISVFKSFLNLSGIESFYCIICSIFHLEYLYLLFLPSQSFADIPKKESFFFFNNLIIGITSIPQFIYILNWIYSTSTTPIDFLPGFFIIFCIATTWVIIWAVILDILSEISPIMTQSNEHVLHLSREIMISCAHFFVVVLVILQNQGTIPWFYQIFSLYHVIAFPIFFLKIRSSQSSKNLSFFRISFLFLKLIYNMELDPRSFPASSYYCTIQKCSLHIFNTMNMFQITSKVCYLSIYVFSQLFMGDLRDFYSIFTIMAALTCIISLILRQQDYLRNPVIFEIDNKVQAQYILAIDAKKRYPCKITEVKPTITIPQFRFIYFRSTDFMTPNKLLDFLLNRLEGAEIRMNNSNKQSFRKWIEYKNSDQQSKSMLVQISKISIERICKIIEKNELLPSIQEINLVTETELISSWNALVKSLVEINAFIRLSSNLPISTNPIVATYNMINSCYQVTLLTNIAYIKNIMPFQQYSQKQIFYDLYEEFDFI